MSRRHCEIDLHVTTRAKSHDTTKYSTTPSSQQSISQMKFFPAKLRILNHNGESIVIYFRFCHRTFEAIVR